jgi:metal-dependent amidase/aminoacylase/carboxypeptidase family protein
LVEKLRRCAEGAALATGAELSFKKVGHEYKAIRPNHALAEAFRHHIEELGYPVEEPKGWMGSTDMGDVSWEVPAIHPYIRIGPEEKDSLFSGEIAGHSREFAQAARSEGAKKAMIASAKALAAIALDLWTDSELAQKVQEDFAKRKARSFLRNVQGTGS